MTSPRQRPGPVALTRPLRLVPDPWQAAVLASTHPRLLLNCCRQAGKSTTVALLALAEALFTPGSRVLLLSRSLRQAAELFRTLIRFHGHFERFLLSHHNAQELTLLNCSRVLCLPCREDTIRGYANVSFLVIDEAARVPDDLYRAVRPMLAVSDGRLALLSTPFGPRGFFHDAWANGGDDWLRVEVPASQVPRISPAFLEEERRALGDVWFRQEYCCSFEALEGLVYPDFDHCLIDAWPSPPPEGWRMGGIDWGFQNPFAAVWGVHDREHDVLWIAGEHYARHKTLDDHILALRARAQADPLCPPPESVLWYADPSGPEWIARCRYANWKVGKGFNDIRLGIAAMTTRIRTGRLKVLRSGCPNLVSESRLYRYPPECDRAATGETPVDADNHALSALRYLVGYLDQFSLSRRRAGASPTDPLGASPTTPPAPPRDPDDETPAERWRRIWNTPSAWVRVE